LTARFSFYNWLSDFDSTFLAMHRNNLFKPYRELVSETKEKHKSVKERVLKDMGKDRPETGPEVRDLRGAGEASAPPVPEEPLQAPVVQPAKRSRAVRVMPLPDALRPGGPGSVSSGEVPGSDELPDGRRTQRKAKEPVQAERVGKHKHRPKGK